MNRLVITYYTNVKLDRHKNRNNEQRAHWTIGRENESMKKETLKPMDEKYEQKQS